MRQRRKCKVWAYARDFRVPPAVLIGQMAELLGKAEKYSVPVVGTSQDLSSGKTLDRMGLKEALRAVHTGYANAVMVRDVFRLSEDEDTLLRIMEILQDHGAFLICTEEDAHICLRAGGVYGHLYFCMNSVLP